MTYPYGNPSTNFGSGIYDSDFSPEIVTAGVINYRTPVSNVGMKNSFGHQVSLLQNFVNIHLLGRSGDYVSDGYIRMVHCSGINMDAGNDACYLHIDESGVSRGNIGLRPCVASLPYSMGICSAEGIIQLGNPTNIDITISGNKVGILTDNPSCALDVSGNLFIHTTGGDGISLIGDNGFINRIYANATSESQLILGGYSAGNESIITLNDQTTGGMKLGNKLCVSPDDDVWSYDSINGFTSGIVDYSESSNITGWSSYANKEIWIKRLGHTVTSYFRIEGTSDSLTTSFTLPYSAKPCGGLYFTGTCRGTDSTLSCSGGVSWFMIDDTAYFSPRQDDEFGVTEWTSSGGKSILGVLQYEADLD